MNVTFYNRPKMEDTFSIEQVFDIIRHELSHQLTIRDYYCRSKWKRMHSLLDVRKYQGDVNHITGDVNHLALVLNGHKTIITLHDVRHYEEDLSGLKKILFGQLKLKIPLKKVRIITTVSEFMRQKLVELFSLNPAKIEVVHNPAPMDFKFSKKKFDKKKPCILQIGAAPHKNLSRLIRAIEGLSFRLLLIGKKKELTRKELEEKEIEYEWFSNINRQKVYNCYKKCDIVFFASEVEGFGMPILEGNAVGRPVITSKLAAMPEVAGDSALLVNPFKVDEIRDGLLRIKGDEDLRKTLVKNGQKNLERFAPDKIAAQYLDLYKEVAGFG